MVVILRIINNYGSFYHKCPECVKVKQLPDTEEVKLQMLCAIVYSFTKLKNAESLGSDIQGLEGCCNKVFKNRSTGGIITWFSGFDFLQTLLYLGSSVICV